jgi:SAM-dependent methyltransferase
LGYLAIGVDASPAMVERASAKGLRASLGSMEALPLSDSLADGLFCECALSLSADQEAALLEFYRVLKPGGFLALSDLVADEPESGAGGRKAAPSPASSAGGAHKSACAPAWTLGQTLAALKKADFSPIAAEDHSAELRALSAALVWAYGREGLSDLRGRAPAGRGGQETPGLGGASQGAADQVASGQKATKIASCGYALIVAIKAGGEAL